MSDPMNALQSLLAAAQKEAKENENLCLAYEERTNILEAQVKKLTEKLEVAEIRIGHFESHRNALVKDLEDRLRGLGYKPGELQARWRFTEGLVFNYAEVDAALLDAFVNMGGATAWCGDGSSCAVQIVQNICMERDAALAELSAVKAALTELLAHPSDYEGDATETEDGYFLTPLQRAERQARKVLGVK